MKTLGFIFQLVLALTFSGLEMGNATDEKAFEKLEEARGFYAERGVPGKIEKALEAIQIAEDEVEDTEIKYEILVQYSRYIYFKGTRVTEKDEKLARFQSAVDKAQVAKQLFPNYADAYYYYGISLGRWAETNGVMASLSKKKELIESAETANSKLTQAGEPGETIDGYGPNRLLGRIYFKLPGLFGGSHTKSIKYLSITAEKAPLYAINISYYAETLADGDDNEKTLARSLLKKLLANDPQTFNKDRILETVEEFELAKKVQKDLGE